MVLKEVLANGALAEAAPGGDLERVASGVDPDIAAIGVARAQTFADIVLVGATTRTHLRRAAGAPAQGIDRAELDALAVDPVLYWRERAERPWR